MDAKLEVPPVSCQTMKYRASGQLFRWVDLEAVEFHVNGEKSVRHLEDGSPPAFHLPWLCLTLEFIKHSNHTAAHEKHSICWN